MTYTSEGGLATITIRRPGVLNALDPAAVAGLAEAWDRLEHSDDRAAVLTGEGRAFCVGADIRDVPTDFPRAVPGLVAPLSKPVVAAVSGFCIGGGYVLVQHCDLALAAPDARFRYPEAALGFTGGLVVGSAVRMPLKIANELMLLGDWMDADRAERHGVVNRVVPAEVLQERAREWGRRLAGHAPLVLRAMREQVAQTVPRSPIEVAAVTRALLSEMDGSWDKQEGLAAHREKREPNFRGC